MVSRSFGTPPFIVHCQLEYKSSNQGKQITLLKCSILYIQSQIISDDLVNKEDDIA